MSKRNIAIIPVRTGSKRLTNKNILDFFGKPMFVHTVQAAKKSGLFDEIHVSTDSKIIGNVVQKAGVKIEFFRPKHLSDDLTGTIPVLKWVLEKYKSICKKFDDIFNIMPASPFLKKEDLVAAYNICDAPLSPTGFKIKSRKMLFNSFLFMPW